MEKVLIVIPTYNEKENISTIIPEILKLNLNIEILVVDDNSPDGTGKVVDNLAQENPKIQVIHRQEKSGLATAYIAGFHYALKKDYDYIMQMDADFSHDPKYIPDFLKYMKEYDLVLGSRYISGGGVVNWGPLRKFISQGGSFYARNVLGTKIKDFTGGFKCFKKETLIKIDLDSVCSIGYAFNIELTYRTLKNGLKVKEIPIIFVDRRVGKSKMSKSIFLEALFKVWKLKFL